MATKDKDLSPKQIKALMVLSMGQSQEVAAKEAGVRRQTVNAWLKDKDFDAELRRTMERMRMQFESRVMVAGSDGMAVIQKAMRSKDEDRQLRAATAAVNAAVRMGTRYKELQVEGYIPPAPMIVFPEGSKHPIFNPSKIPAQLPDVIDAEAKEIDGDGTDATDSADSAATTGESTG